VLWGGVAGCKSALMHASDRSQPARGALLAAAVQAGTKAIGRTTPRRKKCGRKRTAPAAPEKRPAPKMAPSYGPKTGAKKVRADSRPSHFGGQILVHLGGSFWGARLWKRGMRAQGARRRKLCSRRERQHSDTLRTVAMQSKRRGRGNTDLTRKPTHACRCVGTARGCMSASPLRHTSTAAEKGCAWPNPPCSRRPFCHVPETHSMGPPPVAAKRKRASPTTLPRLEGEHDRRHPV